MSPTDPTDIFERKEEIGPQNFDAAIVAGVAFILLSYGYNCCPKDYKTIVTVIEAAISTFFIFSFRKYLQNFANRNTNYWLNWNIGLNIATYAITIIMQLARNGSASSSHHMSPIVTLLFLLFLFVFVAGTYVYIRLGIVLQQINNDFIGMLEQLGKLYCYLSVPVLFLYVVVSVALVKKHFMHKEVLTLIMTTISVIPIVMLIMIFLKAKKYREDNILR